MALTTVAKLMKHLRADTNTETDLVADYRDSAIANIETYLGRIIWNDPLNPRTFGPVRAVYTKVQGTRITDTAPNANTLASSTDPFGRITNLQQPVKAYGDGPLSELPDYPRIERVINQAIRDLVTEYYTHRNSGIASEGEAGVTQNYGRLVHGLPPRIAQSLKPIRDLTRV